jgi:hypothetical protein
LVRKSCGPQARAGSTPAPGTKPSKKGKQEPNKSADYQRFLCFRAFLFLIVLPLFCSFFLPNEVMEDKEEITRNIGLAFDLLREVINNPAVADAIPDGSTVRFVRVDSQDTRNVPFGVRTPQLLTKGYDFTFSKVS